MSHGTEGATTAPAEVVVFRLNRKGPGTPRQQLEEGEEELPEWTAEEGAVATESPLPSLKVHVQIFSFSFFFFL